MSLALPRFRFRVGPFKRLRFSKPELERPDLRRPLSRLHLPRKMLLLKIVLWMVGVIAFGLGMLQTNLFRVDRVDINGATQLSRDDILSISKIHTGGSIAGINVDAAERHLEAHPWVLHARVDTQWPHVVAITIVEQRAVAIASTSDKKFAQLGPDGTVLRVDATAKVGLPVILNVTAPSDVGAKIGDPAHRLMQVATLMPSSLQPQVVQMQDQAGMLKLGLQAGTVVILGDDSILSDKLLSAASVVSHADPKTIAELDVTSPRFPVARPKERAAPVQTVSPSTTSKPKPGVSTTQPARKKTSVTTATTAVSRSQSG